MEESSPVFEREGHVGDWIREQRRDLGHTQADAAAFLAMSQASLSRLERGFLDPWKWRRYLAMYLDITESEVRLGEEKLRRAEGVLSAMAGEIKSLNRRIHMMAKRHDELLAVLDADSEMPPTGILRPRKSFR